MHQAVKSHRVSIGHRFISWNKEASNRFDGMLGIPWVSIRDEERRVIEGTLSAGDTVADVGGGKKPFYPAGDARIAEYVGIDIERDELERAPAGAYTEIRACDITDSNTDLHDRFDLIICKNTIEHVADTREALTELNRMLKPGGRCYVAVPCRLAPFAILNRLVPERLKRSLLFAIIPEKSGDGFEAHYDKCTPSAFRTIIESCNAKITYEKRFYWSSYFTVFVPVYVVWRLLTGVARRVSDDYCERFHVVFERPADG